MWYYTLDKEEAKTFSCLNPGDAARWLRDYGEDIVFVAVDDYGDMEIHEETVKKVGLSLPGWEPCIRIFADPLGGRLSEDKNDIEEIWAVYLE